MAEDLYDGLDDISAPANSAAAVTPSDSADLSYTARSLYIGVSGDVVVHMRGQTTSVTFTAAPVGILPIRVDRVLSTGTAATNIVALW